MLRALSSSPIIALVHSLPSLPCHHPAPQVRPQEHGAGTGMEQQRQLAGQRVQGPADQGALAVVNVGSRVCRALNIFRDSLSRVQGSLCLSEFSPLMFVCYGFAHGRPFPFPASGYPHDEGSGVVQGAH